MEFDQFIGTAHSVLDDEKCDELIVKMNGVIEQRLHDADKFGFEGDKQLPKGKLSRDDYQIYIPQDMAEVYEYLVDILYTGVQEYCNEYPAVKNSGPFFLNNFKAQKTSKNQLGFSDFHMEQGAGMGAGRVLVWTLYLNDVTDGGETEFPYQSLKVKPEKGMLCIFPASFTHTHRGNPPYSNDKYILTGWVTFFQDEDALRTVLKG